jgi:hypothetical protein
MRKKFAKDPFVAVSVSLDERGDPDKTAEKRKAILKFLDRVHATMTNLWLEEENAVWQEKLNIAWVPCVYVFDKDGHYVAKLYDSEFNPTVVENLVEELLKR